MQALAVHPDLHETQAKNEHNEALQHGVSYKNSVTGLKSRSGESADEHWSRYQATNPTPKQLPKFDPVRDQLADVRSQAGKLSGQAHDQAFKQGKPSKETADKLRQAVDHYSIAADAAEQSGDMKEAQRLRAVAVQTRNAATGHDIMATHPQLARTEGKATEMEPKHIQQYNKLREKGVSHEKAADKVLANAQKKSLDHLDDAVQNAGSALDTGDPFQSFVDLQKAAGAVVRHGAGTPAVQTWAKALSKAPHADIEAHLDDMPTSITNRQDSADDLDEAPMPLRQTLEKILDAVDDDGQYFDPTDSDEMMAKKILHCLSGCSE